MKRILRALCYKHKKDCDTCIRATLFALRTVPHESTGFALAELVYGRNLRSPILMLREIWAGIGEDTTVVEYILTLLDRTNYARKLAEREMKASRDSAKAYYDRNSRECTFSPGDKVMFLRPAKANKLEIQWEGLALVLKNYPPLIT